MKTDRSMYDERIWLEDFRDSHKENPKKILSRSTRSSPVPHPYTEPAYFLYLSGMHFTGALLYYDIQLSDMHFTGAILYYDIQLAVWNGSRRYCIIVL